MLVRIWCSDMQQPVITGIESTGRQGCGRDINGGSHQSASIFESTLKLTKLSFPPSLHIFLFSLSLHFYHWNHKWDAQEMVLSLNNVSVWIENPAEGKDQRLLSPVLMSAALGLSIPSSKGTSIPTSSEISLEESKAKDVKHCVGGNFLWKGSPEIPG